MKLNVYVTALVDADIIIDVPENATKEQVISAVIQKIIDNNPFKQDNAPELRYIEDNDTGRIYYDD
jgi:hypothetical protein